MTDEQDAMLDAVIYLHSQNVPSDIFPFSWYGAQRYLDEKGLSQKLGIDPPMDHVRLLRELADLGVFKMSIDILENYSALSDAPEDVEKREYVIPINGNYCIFTICMNNKDAREAKRRLSKKYEAKLIFSDGDVGIYSRFRISIKGDKTYNFRRLREDGYTYKTLCYAIEQRRNGRDEPIMREELIENGKMRVDHKYVSNLFKDQPVIREALSPFVDIQTDSIFFKGFSASITEEQREIIQKHSR